MESFHAGLTNRSTWGLAKNTKEYNGEILVKKNMKRKKKEKKNE